MTTIESISRGMNALAPAEHLPEATAARILNMRPGKDGVWRAIPAPAASDIPAETRHIYPWKPVYMPFDALEGEDEVYVYFEDGACYLFYRSGREHWEPEHWERQTLLPVGRLNQESIRCAQDATQFVFLDGRESVGAMRIIIDKDGKTSCRRFGTQAPDTAPTVVLIENDKYRDNDFTGMAVGSILYYAYCVVNEYGERSNPSPVVVCDTAQWLAKGELLVDDYQYTDVNGGSIKSVSVQCKIPVPAEAKRIELYRSHLEYFEAETPRDPLRLVRSDLVRPGATTMTVTDTSFPSPIEADYENDSAPAGDDISLEAGTIFIANAVSEVTFIHPTKRAWSITLSNRNKICYANRWFCIDLRGVQAGAARCEFEGLENMASLFSGGRYRFVDIDMTTPLKAYGYPYSADRKTKTAATWLEITDPVGGGTKYALCPVWIQIPYLAANTDHTIYLVEFKSSHPDYGTDIVDMTDDDGDADLTGMLDTWIDNPVRDSKCFLSLGRIEELPTVSGGWQDSNINKANAALDKISDYYEYTALGFFRRYGILQHNEVASDEPCTSAVNYIYTTTQNYAGIRWHRHIPAEYQKSGYFYLNFHIRGQPRDEYIYLIRLLTQDLGSNLPSGDGYSVKIVRHYSKGQKIMVHRDKDNAPDPDCDIYHTYSTGPLPSDGVTPDIDVALLISWQVETDVSVKFTISTVSRQGTSSVEHNTTTNSIGVSFPDTEGRSGIYISSYDYNSWSAGVSLGTGRHYLALGEYIDDPYENYALLRYDTHFPVEPIGLRNHNYADANGYLENKNVWVSSLPMENDKRPGKVRWSNGGAVPDLFEHSVYDEIKRIMPLKSFQPTDEHNTLLIWTEKSLLRLALDGINKAASAIITEVRGIGLQAPDALVRVTDGVIWSERSGVYYYSPAGLKEISRGRVGTGYTRAIYNEKEHEVLFYGTGTTAKTYNIDHDVWYDIDYELDAQNIVEIGGEQCLVTAEGATILEPRGDDTTLSPYILTRKFYASGKIRRVTLHSNGGTLRGIVHNHRLYRTGNPKYTPTYNMIADTPKGIPQLSGDYVQFEIVTDSLKTIEIEDNLNNG